MCAVIRSPQQAVSGSVTQYLVHASFIIMQYILQLKILHFGRNCVSNVFMLKPGILIKEHNLSTFRKFYSFNSKLKTFNQMLVGSNYKLNVLLPEYPNRKTLIIVTITLTMQSHFKLS